MVFKLCWQANKRNFQIRVEMFSSITPLFSLLLCVLTSTTTSYLFRNGKVTHLPRGSTFRKFASNNYELNVKDILLADSYSGLTRAEINEYVIKVSFILSNIFPNGFWLHNTKLFQLEKQNPTVDPAFSPLLNGVWEVVCGGIFSPGLIGYQAIKTLPSQLIEVVNDLTVTISSQAPRVTASTSLKIASATTLDFSVTTDIVAESGKHNTLSVYSSTSNVIWNKQAWD